ncbi:hypothetical protein N8865_01055 [Francisellaceae bacterium]|nr:hypothetical protein [Francisellaceae bacterium]
MKKEPYLKRVVNQNKSFSKDVASLFDIFIGLGLFAFLIVHLGISLSSALLLGLIAVIFVFRAKAAIKMADKLDITLQSSGRLQIRTILTIVMAIVATLAIFNAFKSLL